MILLYNPQGMLAIAVAILCLLLLIPIVFRFIPIFCDLAKTAVSEPRTRVSKKTANKGFKISLKVGIVYILLVCVDIIWIASLLAHRLGPTSQKVTFAIVLFLDFSLYIAAFVVMLIKRQSWELKINPHPREPYSLSHPSKDWIKYWNRNADQGSEQLNWGCLPNMLITLVWLISLYVVVRFLAPP
jgi:hypothetical protein